MATTKISIQLGFLRIFPSTTFRRLVISCIVFTVVWGVVSSIIFMLQCKPVSFVWRGWTGMESGSCLSTSALIWSTSVIAIITDILMLTMPVFQLWPLPIPLRKKPLVIFMLCIGLFVTIISIIRLYAIARYQYSTNMTYNVTSLALWSVIEADMSGVCACLPQARLLLSRWFPK
ncbi:hypothetical protein B0J15DRAFT_433911, partial [Fusarium solani]